MNKEVKNNDIKIIDNPNEIFKYLDIGTNIPILPEFYPYILGDIKNYGAKAIIIKEQNDVKGITLFYDDGGSTLFFGFFGVKNHDLNKIEILIDKLIDYASENDYKLVRGPINIPTVIFGWGFMVEGSNTELFIGCPVNPSIYQEIFLKKKFYVKFKELRYKMAVLKINPHNKTLNYDFSDYEFINPGREGMIKIKEDFVNLHVKYLPPSARLTPASLKNFDNIVDFVFTHGKEWMMWILLHKPTKKIVAGGYVIPNIFHKDKRGYMDSMSFHDWVVHPDHRRKHLTLLMYGETSLRTLNRKTKSFIRWGLWPVGADNVASVKGAKKMGGIKDRTHLILEYTL